MEELNMEYLWPVLGILVVVVLLTRGIGRNVIGRITVFEYEKGVKYSKGKMSGVLEPGVYWYLPHATTIMKVDTRARFASITGQEVLSSDGVTIKVSIAANYEITNPIIAINTVQDYQQALYLELQMAVREIVGERAIDDVTGKRSEISKSLIEKTQGKAEALGLKLISVDIKDIMFPGVMKQLFAQVVNARKEGQASLERARGESAALRSLANAARLLEGNPNLMQLRLLQSIGQSSGNTIVLGVPTGSTTIPIRTKDISERVEGEKQEELG
jgi:regulator of protease activity HflC (stomatin/prohibitin superfamily)